MTVEKFLSFWSQHNTTIIEGLVALIILFSLFLAYRAFFGKKDVSHADSEEGQSLNAAQLEKTLQKILENQSQQSGKATKAAKSEDFSVDVELDETALAARAAKAAAGTAEGVAEAAAESAAEVAQLRLTLNESHQKIETLQTQLQEALAAAQAAAAGGAAPAGDAGGGLSQAEREDLTGKVRDLEARLAEYEIISEDIADLSRYRDENEALRKELEALKAGGAAAAVAPAQASAPAAPAPEPEPTPAPEPTPEVAAAPEPEAPAAPAEEGSSLIDDDLMKEFAAAVEGQKALDKAAEKAGDGTDEAPKNGDETNELMNEFENFVTKKS